MDNTNTNNSAKEQQPRQQLLHTNSSKKQGGRKGATKKEGSGSTTKNQSNHNVALSKALSWITRHAAPKLGLPIATDGYIPLQLILKCQSRNMNKYTMEDIQKVVEANDKQRFTLTLKKVIWNDNHGSTKKKTKCTFVDDMQNNVNDIGAGGERSDASNAVRIEEVLCIRANQGHSIHTVNTEELLTPIQPNELSEMGTIIHGTTKEAWLNHIQQEGLNKMKRNHIHFAAGFPCADGIISGMRKSSQVYIYVNGKACAEDGIKFYRSSNGVILTEGMDGKGGVLPVRYFAKVQDAKTNEILL